MNTEPIFPLKKKSQSYATATFALAASQGANSVKIQYVSLEHIAPRWPVGQIELHFFPKVLAAKHWSTNLFWS